MTPLRHTLAVCHSPAHVRVLPSTRQQPGRSGSRHAWCDLAAPRTPDRRSSGRWPWHKRRPRLAAPSCPRSWTHLSLALLTLLIFCSSCPGAIASSLHVRTLEHMVFHDELLIDRSPRPVAPMALRARQDGSIGDVSSTTATTIDQGASTTTTASSLDVAAPTATNSLPRPFDTNLGNNFTTTSCPQFFQTFLKDDAFNNCLPLSLLLQTSNAFFQASQSLVRLTQTLDATCHVDFAQCSSLMSSLATQIQADSNCGADYEMQNPMVLQAYHGFQAYSPLYHAGCLTDSRSMAVGTYCFANAITDTSAPTSSYVYYLPLGVQLPAGTRPTCNTCLHDTMSIFAAAASNHTQPLASEYMAAAQQIDMGCGPTFVNTSVTPTSAASPLALPRIPGIFTILIMALMFFMS